jgi:hypothetical protein
MKYKYTGTDERVIPSLGIVVKPNEEFEAPENFVAAEITPVGAKPTNVKASEVSDLKAGE